MVRETIRLVAGWLRHAVTEPFQELTRWQRAARFAYDLGRYGARQLQQDRAPQMAAALAFHTLFGLAPVLVVTTILVKSVRGTDAILQWLHELFVVAGLDDLRVVAVPQVGGETGGEAVTLADWLVELTGQLATINLSAIGLVGSAVIVFAAIGLMVTIENSFNTIYRASGGRQWTRRVPLYWFLLTVCPVVVGVASYVNDQFTGWIASVDTWQWLLVSAQALWSFGLVWLFMFAVYTLVPNATVTMRPAVAGALVASLLLAAGKHTLGAFLGSAFSVNQLYGSLGLVPLFMLWVYLMWLSVLFGLQVSATLQMLRGRSLAEMDHPGERTRLVDPTVVLTMMEEIAEQFAAGRPVTPRQLADSQALPEPTVTRIIDRFVLSGWLHRVEHPEPAVSLAKPPEQLTAHELLEAGYQLVDEGAPGRCSAFIRQLRDAQEKLAAGVTLATLVSARGERLADGSG